MAYQKFFPKRRGNNKKLGCKKVFPKGVLKGKTPNYKPWHSLFNN